MPNLVEKLSIAFPGQEWTFKYNEDGSEPDFDEVVWIKGAKPSRQDMEARVASHVPPKSLVERVEDLERRLTVLEKRP
jgi:hypothetical protein